MTSNEKFSRPIRVGPGAPLGITEVMIHDVVHCFYGKIRSDPALGPIFERVMSDDWDTHLGKMCDFWSSVLLMTGRFKGSPMVTHAKINDIEPQHFVRWLELFRQTVEKMCPADAAALFMEKANMIARSLQLGIAVSRNNDFPVTT